MKKDAKFKFRFYVAGEAHNSAQALANRNSLTPTLIRLGPLPLRRIVGAFSQAQVVLQAPGLEAVTP